MTACADFLAKQFYAYVPACVILVNQNKNISLRLIILKVNLKKLVFKNEK